MLGALSTKLPTLALEKCNLTTFEQFETSCEHSGDDFLCHLSPVALVQEYMAWDMGLEAGHSAQFQPRSQ